MRRRKPATVIAFLVLLAVIWALKNYGGLGEPAGSESTGREPPEALPKTAPSGGRSPGGDTPVSNALRGAIAGQRSGVWVEGSGTIVHLLPEDRRPPRHQLCLVELANGHTIKISHNVDIAPKVPWRKGEKIDFRGRFEWNAKGGVVHWTHRDPGGRKAGGWLAYDGKRYR